MKLTEQERIDYLEKHLPYRLNNMRAYEIYISRRTSKDYETEKQPFKCYWESEHLEPAFEISIVFGRSLLDFLGIKKEGTELKKLNKERHKDDVHIWDIIPEKESYPVEILRDVEQKNLINLIKVANKSAAHLTTSTSTQEELESIQPATRIIYKMMIDYVDGLNKDKLWVKSTATNSV